MGQRKFTLLYGYLLFKRTQPKSKSMNPYSYIKFQLSFNQLRAFWRAALCSWIVKFLYAIFMGIFWFLSPFPVIVSPHGMRGRLTGCCPADLVKQVYLRSNLLLYFLLFWVVLIPSFSLSLSSCLSTKFFRSDRARLIVVPYCDSCLTCQTVLASLVLQTVLLGYHPMFLNLVISLRDRIAMLKLTSVPLHRETTIYKKVPMYRIIHQGLP